jgi:shikimate dehydrogenase
MSGIISAINGATRVCGLFGHPVEHSFSPLMHNAAFGALGLNYVYLPFAVRPENLGTAVDALRILHLAGVNVTIPHKEAVLGHLDEVSPEARLIGAVNTVVNRSGHLVGHNTDGPGFVEALSRRAGFTPGGKRVLLLGAGGAARAVAVQLALAGAELITVVNRSPGRAGKLVELLSGHTAVRAEFLFWDPGSTAQSSDFVNAARLADLIVQCTPLGMYPGVDLAPEFPFAVLRPGRLVCDLVYNPVRTKFLIRAEMAGARVVDGLEMLIYQGALSFALWTGHTAPAGVMRRALEHYLGQGQGDLW